LRDVRAGEEASGVAQVRSVAGLRRQRRSLGSGLKKDKHSYEREDRTIEVK
jgi:hypothetical protein